MCDEYELFEFIEADNRVEKRKRRRLNREANDPFDMDENEFIKEYRLTPDMVKSLCQELTPFMKTNPRRDTDLSVETKVLTAIYVYAHGSYQKPTGRAQNLAQPTVSSVLHEVTAAMNTPEIRGKYIKFPQSAEERLAVKTKFYQDFGIPGVVGCIDGTHIAIVRPVVNEERYYCRKHYHSLNVQLVCDADMNIMSVDASQPGSNHDAFIFNNHPLRQHLQNITNNEATWLLGDSGYALRKFMMTPILDCVPGSPEALYTHMHVRARNVIERTIGLLKARFRCLLAHRVLHYDPQTAGNIVNACVILHNICNKANVPVAELSPEELQEEVARQPLPVEVTPDVEGTGRQNTDLQAGIATRNQLVTRLWEEQQQHQPRI